MEVQADHATMCALAGRVKNPDYRVGLAKRNTVSLTPRASASYNLVGDAIFVQGEEDENTGCVLLQGEVEVLRDNQDAIRVPAPDLLGEMQQLEPTAQRTATVQVTGDAQTVLRDAIRAAAARRHA